MGSGTDNVDPSGAVWLDDHCNLWVGDEVGKVGGEASGDDKVRKVNGDDEGGEGVLGVRPVPPLLILPYAARQKQAGHTADYQTAPVWFLWQLPHGLLSTIFATKGRGRWRKPCYAQCQCQCQCRCELKDES